MVSVSLELQISVVQRTGSCIKTVEDSNKIPFANSSCPYNEE